MIVPDRLDAVQTLVYYDGPFSEVLRDRVTGDLYYAHWADVDATHHTWLVASMPAERLRLLGDGHLFVRDLLESAEALYVGRHDGERWCSMTPAVFAHLDPEWVPDADAILPREEWHEKEMAQWSSDPAEIEALAVSVFDDEATPADHEQAQTYLDALPTLPPRTGDDPPELDFDHKDT